MFDIRDYGAKADAVTDNTAFIQKAIDASAEAGGGTVLVSGGVFMTYTLKLRSGVRLEIEAGTTLRGGPEPLKYPEIPDNPYWLPSRCSRLNRRALIYAEHCTDTAITGRGVIDGNALVFTHTDDIPRDLHEVWQRKDDRLIPGRTIMMAGCTNVLLEDFKIWNSAGWSTWILDCECVRVSRLRIDCEMRLPNADGLHLSACRKVTVSDCIIRASDDALIIRAHREQLQNPSPCSDITVINCVLESGSSGIRIGWRGDGEISDCLFSNLVIRHSFAGISVFIPHESRNQLDPPRLADSPVPPPEAPMNFRRLRFDNINMDTEAAPIMIALPDDQMFGEIGFLDFCHIRAHSNSFPRIHSDVPDVLHDVTISDSTFDIEPGPRENLIRYPSYSARMDVVNVSGFRMNNVCMNCRGILPEMTK